MRVPAAPDVIIIVVRSGQKLLVAIMPNCSPLITVRSGDYYEFG